MSLSVLTNRDVSFSARTVQILFARAENKTLASRRPAVDWPPMLLRKYGCDSSGTSLLRRTLSCGAALAVVMVTESLAADSGRRR